jgi:dephospho-CoA kinase
MSIGITGGIGSGKTVVCNVFRQLGIPVFEADAEAKKLYDTVPEISERIKKDISEDVFDKKGKPDKQKLAALVFENETLLKKLNKIVHPYVLKQFEEWKKLHSKAPYILYEAAILFESGSDKGTDKVIMVSAPVEQRIQRTMVRDKKTKEEVEQIMRRQWNDEEKIKRSDFVIINNEQQPLIPQVLEIHHSLVELSKSLIT